MKKKVLKKSAIFKISCTFLILLAAFAIVNLFTATTTLSNIEEVWNGVDIATSFSGGNGTADNPYKISNGNELAYFKQLVETNALELKDKYFVLVNDIDLGNHNWQGIGTIVDEEEMFFSGHLDGCGYTIKNFKINLPTTIHNTDYYGFFNKVDNAEIKNLNFENIEISTISSLNNIVLGTLIGEVKSGSTISNIAVINATLDLSKTLANKEHHIGGLFANVSKEAKLENIYNNMEINDTNANTFGNVFGTLEGKAKNIITEVTYTNFLSVNIGTSATTTEEATLENNYELIASNNQLYVDKSDITIDTILTELNSGLEDSYTWIQENTILRIRRVEDVEVTITKEEETVPTLFSFGRSASITLHDTGITDTTVYINDLESDYNYYQGLNYTESSTGTLPPGTNQNIYNDSNLVPIYVKYSGVDVNNPDLVGHVSLTEQQSEYIYYKYYPVVNGYVEFELIDNPFASRPNDKVFNGWVTDYYGAEVYIDMDEYVRYVRIPVTDTSTPISITFYSSWSDGTIVQLTSGSSMTGAISSLDNAGMKAYGQGDPIYEDVDMRNYFIYGGELSYRENYPSGSYDEEGNSASGNRCNSFIGGCTYYLRPTSPEYDPSQTYYEPITTGTGWWEETTMEEFAPDIIGYEPSDSLPEGSVVAGYFRQVTIPYNNSYAGYYDSTGIRQEAGTCRDRNGCSYYDYIDYYDENGNVSVATSDEEYYYLVTRDTNIVVLRNNFSGDLENNKPMTLTSLNNGTDYRNNATFSISSYYIKANADLRIEYVRLNSNYNSENDVAPPSSSSGNSANRYIFGNWNNLKIGRGIMQVGNYKTARGVLAGDNSSNTGSSSAPEKYRLIVESGFYNTLSATNGTSSRTLYLDGDVIYGNDYDRISGNNDNLDIYFCASGSWGGYIYAGTNRVGFTTTVKSGTFGSGKYDYSTGIYVGGRNGGTSYAERHAIIEGGYIYNLIGGPLTAENRSEINDTFINMKGGTVDMIIGGAGASETYGNRIVNVTGGTVNYGVFGGSNGYTGGDSGNYKGTLSGSTLVYIGGNTTVGNEQYISSNNTLFGVSSGNVFGIGNGNSDSTQVGSADHSNVIIDGNAKVLQNVYGGGNYGATGLVPYQDHNGTKDSTTNIKILGGTVTGGVYGGGNNNGSGGTATYRTSNWGGGTTYTTTVTSTIHIEMSGGTVGYVYGGSRIKGTVYGDTNVSVLAGTVTKDVYGGGEGGYDSTRNPGTFIEKNVNVIIGTASTSPTIEGSVYGGSAYGSVNGTTNNGSATNQYTTNVTVHNGIVEDSVYGGGKGSIDYTPRVYGNVTVIVNNGNIANVFGGNDAAGSPSNEDVVYLNGGIIGNAYGGGNQTGQTTTNIYLQGAEVTGKLFGGSNESGTVTTANVHVTSGTAVNIYGGNNIGGRTETANVTITGGTVTGDVYGGGSLADTGNTHLYLGNATINNVYGGGENASATTTESTIEGATITNFFGGSNISGEVDTASITMNSGTVGTIYGGNNQGGTTNTADITINNGEVGTIYGGGNEAPSTFADININNGTIENIYGGGNKAGLNTTTIDVLAGAIGNIYGGSNQSGNITDTTITIASNDTITVDNIYGGNNQGGTTTNAIVDVNGGVIGNVFGGGNEAVVSAPIVTIDNATVNNVFGGGNMAEITGDTSVTITNSHINTNLYGGGNEGEVSGSTNVHITSSTILGSAYAGGNGATAIVHRNTTITAEGTTTIGAPGVKPPQAGCLFGGGNAAATGTTEQNNSLATVNITGATIYGNVYGGANTSVVYGKTDTNIGTNAVGDSSLSEGNIYIGGTVFGGGEANAAGDENYDFSFISVTGAIDIDIDGLNYLNNSHSFTISGSIFGSGNASSSSGTSEIYVANLGTRNNPSKNISIQRANTVVLDNTVMELEGTTDRTNEYSDIEYSLNRIDELNIKNNTMLLLQRNANLLQSFKSTVDVNGQEEKATVIIDDETKTVTKNVDNRLYMLANRNLNITTNEAATAYGPVSGMTFFGMYNRYGNGSFSYGLYDDEVDYGDTGDAGDVIVGGSYVLGLHNLNHDITVDGFYSNYIDDSYTEITTAYIEPTPPDSNYYMWTIGISAINYNFTMTASKYSSLGTYELSLRDFANGDTTFEVVGFNSEGLTSGVGLVDSNNVPKVADTEEEANSILGLSMKTETSEWTSYGTTKFLSNNNGIYTGDRVYKTDSQALAPSLMFYLYHAKNITLDQELGTVVVTLQARTPINEIEYDVQLITITIDLTTRNYDDGNAYDASITYDKKYEMPAATTVNITNQSQFTAYFDLFATSDTFEDFYGRGNTNYHALVTDYALPVGTQITMLDYGREDGKPDYYYFTVDQDDYNRALAQLQSENEVTYRLSNFIKMGSTSEDNTYDDKTANESYYDDTEKRTMEEFIFIFDFKETTTTGDNLNKYIRFELRNNEDRAVVTVLGIRQNLMYFNLYESSNMVLNQQVALDNNYIYSNTDNHISYTTSVTYDQTDNREAIINTNYESTSMGLNVTLYDQTGSQVSSSLLTGTSIRMDNTEYFADSEGVFRIKLSGKVSNLNKDLYLTTDENLPPGNYKIVFTLFASSDGLHNSGDLQYVEEEFDVIVVTSGNAITVSSVDEEQVINGLTGQNQKETKDSTFTIKTSQSLSNPNIRVSLYKRNIDNKDETTYTEVPLEQVFNHTYRRPEETGLVSGSTSEYVASYVAQQEQTVTLPYQENLTSGTYRIVFRLYDQNQLIDEDIEYFIIKKLE